MVEDEPLLRDLIAKSVEASGFIVSTAANAADAKRAIKVSDPDAPVLDIELGQRKVKVLSCMKPSATGTTLKKTATRFGWSWRYHLALQAKLYLLSSWGLATRAFTNYCCGSSRVVECLN